MKTIATDLVPVYETDLGQKVVNGRELHQFLEVGKDFSTWMKDRIEKYGFEEGLDYTVTLTKIGERSNVTRHDYFIQLDAAKEIAMVENNDQGRKVRKYFIEVEKHHQAQIAQPQLALPQTMPEALRMLATEMEQRQLITAENERLALHAAEQEAQLQYQAPRVAFANMVVAAGNTQPMGTVAKAVGMGRNNLFKFLRDKKVIMRNSTLPYQEYIDRGYFVVREVPTKRGDDMIVNEPAARVTAKGLEYIAKLIRENQGA